MQQNGASRLCLIKNDLPKVEPSLLVLNPSHCDRPYAALDATKRISAINAKRPLAPEKASSLSKQADTNPVENH
ncbi:hypothetical protein CEXT_694861 [Caerostris extrusa]|uniref:Uncharacterized protein n=1 Tax=Caerostris extrusa TaxID=172846 RepID=A0AAV4QFS5_CAEEX|nr:hypothetical protein CEXT_694861 [Caerostris extrusa]